MPLIPMVPFSRVRLVAGSGALFVTMTSVTADAQTTIREIPLKACAQLSSLSRDGTTVVGQLEDGTAATWQADSGITQLGSFCARSVSGGWICGQGTLSGGDLHSAYLWTPSNGLQEIPNPLNQEIQARAVSNGTVVGVAGGRAAFLVMSGEHRPVPGLAADYDSAANAITRQTYQSYVVGVVNSWTGYRGFVHSFDVLGSPDSTEVLASPSGGPCAASGVSKFANFVVGEIPVAGSSFSWSLLNQACVWTRGSASGSYLPTPLCNPPGMQRSDAYGVSTWAEIVAGTCYSSGAGFRATVWKGNRRPIDLRRLVACTGQSEDVPMLTVAIAVSDDARTVLAMDPSLKLYLISGFPSVVPPLTDLNWDGSTDGIDLGLLLSEWGPVDADALADMTGDGFVDGLDLAQLLANWGGCSY